MKIAVVSTPILKLGVGGLSGYGGLEHLAWLQAKGLAELGHEVTLVAPDGSSCPGVRVLGIGEERRVREKEAHNRAWQHYLRVDCVIDNSWEKWSYLLKGEGAMKAPVLGVIHAPVATMYQSLPPGVPRPCFVCISQDQAERFEDMHRREARVAYNGIDPDFYQKINIPRTDRFLFLARFSTVKSPLIAIEACLEAGVGLDLVGDTGLANEPAYFQQCTQLADKESPGWDRKNKGKQIRIYEGCTRGVTVWWYSQAHAMIHPNKIFPEPFGLAPCESMACGTPVIAWKYGAMKETVKEGTSGWLVKSERQLVETVKRVAAVGPDPEMRKASRDWASQFSIEKMVKRYESLCQEAVETGGW